MPSLACRANNFMKGSVHVAAYPMNICKLNQLDHVIKKEVRVKDMLGIQASDERLSERCVQGDQAMHHMLNVEINDSVDKAAWRREQLKTGNAIIAECLTIMEEVGVEMRFEGENIRLDNDLIEAE